MLGVAHVRRRVPRLHRPAGQRARPRRLRRARHPPRLCARPCFHRRRLCREAARLPCAIPGVIVLSRPHEGEPSMHNLSIPQSVVARVIERRSREHIHADLDPAKTALVVVDMQNAFMLPGVAHALCPTAEKIVPNINRLARAVRETGGTVVWIKTTYTPDTRKDWSTYYDLRGPEQNDKRAQALAAGSKGHELWAELD